METGPQEKMSRFIATFSGLRWVHDEYSYTRIICYVKAFAKTLPELVKDCPTTRTKNLVYVGRDGRATGNVYPQFIIATLLVSGFDVAYVDVVPTPTVQQMVRNSCCAGGVIATASHNPPKWNGLKFVGPRSIFLTPAECECVYGQVTDEVLLEENKCNNNTSDFYKIVESVAKAIDAREGFKHNKAQLKYMGTEIAIEAHIKHVLSNSAVVNQFLIREAKLSIGFSGCNASGATYIASLCEHLGVELKVPYLMDVGPLPLQPEPIPENLAQFTAELKEHQGAVHVAFAVDPDADRLVILDEAGIPLGEDYTLALCIDYLLSLQEPGEYHIVTNVSTSLVVAEACKKHEAKGIKGILHCTAVGEVNVALKMLELADKCLIGGEGNGGVMLPCAHIGRDSIVAVALVLCWLAKIRKLEGDKPISALVSGRFQRYYITKAKFTLKEGDREKLEAKLQELAKDTSQYEVDTVDGVKFISMERKEWVHIRFSNTEPIIRIIAEAASEDVPTKLIATYQKALAL